MGEQLVVDGYNVVYAWPELRRLVNVSLELARDRLVERLATLAQIRDVEVTVVFDAHRTRALRHHEEMRDGVRVVFTRKGDSADHVIERQAYRVRRAGEPFLVATSDAFHRAMLRGMGAAVIDADELRRRVEAAEAELVRRLRQYRP